MFTAASPGIPSFGDRAWHEPCNVLAFQALPACTYAGNGLSLTANANGLLSINGTAVVVGLRVLVIGQAARQQNGIYSVTATGSAGAPWVLTRAGDANLIANVPRGSTVWVVGDTVSEMDLAFVLSTAPVDFTQTQAWVPWRGPAVQFYNSAIQSIPNAAATQLTLNTQQYGGTAWGTPPLTLITVPASFGGIWHVNAGMSFANSAVGIRELLLLVGGVLNAESSEPAVSGAPTALSIAADVLIQAGQTIGLQAFQNSGGALNTGSGFAVFLAVHWVKG